MNLFDSGRTAHIPVGKLAHMDQAVLVYADVNEGAEEGLRAHSLEFFQLLLIRVVLVLAHADRLGIDFRISAATFFPENGINHRFYIRNVTLIKKRILKVICGY